MGRTTSLGKTDSHAYTVNFMGEELMPCLQKTIPELSAYCGGTTVAFGGWGNKKLHLSNLNATIGIHGRRTSHNENGVDATLYYDHLQTGKIYYYMIDCVKENISVREQLEKLGNYVY